MRYSKPLTAGIITSLVVGFFYFQIPEPQVEEALGAPSTEVTYQKNLIPLTDSLYTVGTTTKAWLNGFFDQLCLGGDCKTAWPTGGAGGGAGSSNWTILSGGLRTSTSTDFAQASYFIATSTTGTSTFAGDITMQHNKYLTTHGIRGDASDGLYIQSNSGLNVADFGLGNSQNSTFYGGVNIDGATRLATSLTGILQAVSGTVSATSSITVTNATSTTSFFSALGTFTNAVIGTLLTVANQTISGTLTLLENATIALDPAGSADGKYTGTTMTGTAGYTQAYGDLVYLDPTDSRWEAVDANAVSGADGDARGILGLVVSTGTDGTSCTILLNGIIRADAKFPTFTVNNPIYISETAGIVTQTQPSTTDVVIRIVGDALTTDEMYFNPSNDYLTHI